MKHLDTPAEVIESILKEVWHTLKKLDGVEMMHGHPEEQDVRALDTKLLEVLSCAHSLNSDVLVSWLRYTYAWRSRLPTWRLLLNAVHEHLLVRHPADLVDELLKGLLPSLEKQ